MPITEEIIEKVEKFSGDEVRPIIGDGYPLFEWDTVIEINEAMKNDEE